MDCFCHEDQILVEYDRLCIGMAKKWLTDHNFTRTVEIWDDALQCARLGFLMYLRKYQITRAEDVFKDGTSPYWFMYSELSRGIIMGACAPCGIHRPKNKAKLKVTTATLDEIVNDARYSTASGEAIVVSEMTVTECLANLREDERQIATLRMTGLKPGEIQRRLGVTPDEYSYKILRIRKSLKAE